MDPEPLPEIWRYWDWVVAALNSDMPYDQFVRAQIAGDVGAENREAGYSDRVLCGGSDLHDPIGEPSALPGRLSKFDSS